MPPKGVCVFDIDNTLTCGDPERAIRHCKERGYAVAINTARPVRWLNHDLKELGLPNPDDATFIHNPKSWTQTPSQRAQAKGVAMDTLAQHFNTKNLILFDDLQLNVDAAVKKGYRARRVSADGTCGISLEDLAQVQ